jgi:micrococcal nuclease
MQKEAILLVILLTALSGCDSIAGFYADEKQTAIATRVTDGDTITIEGGERVRLLGINSPEKGEKFYSEGKQFVEQRILYKEVELERDVIDKDQYGRILRYVWLNGELVNEQIIRQGLAIAQIYEPNHKYNKAIAAAEKAAINEKLGIWNEIG